MTTFADFRARLPQSDIPAQIHDSLIGRNLTVPGPNGPVPMLYADYVASGRAVSLIEDFVRDQVLPLYANSHTEASFCGAAMTALRHEARAEIARLCDAGPDCAVVFTGSGATAGLNRLTDLLGVRKRPFRRRATVLVGPYEHHSNILPWREAGARVIEISEAPCGGPDLAHLEAELRRARGRVIGAFSAMSNVSGIVTDIAAVTALLNRYGARVVWDYAGAGPYLPISMQPGGHRVDAIVTSVHKFIGGPGASGVMILRRDAVCLDRPSQPGGGTVRFVSSEAQDYHAALEMREEAGTPNVIGDIRAGLCFVLKEAIGAEWISARNATLAGRALEALKEVPEIDLLGNAECPRVPVLSFRVRDGQGGHYHHQLVTRILSDHYGIQSRGGCACAGPYVLRLFGYDQAGARKLRQVIASGDDMARPGFVRLNLSYLMSDDEVARILGALAEISAQIGRLAPEYACDTKTTMFAPRDALAGAA